MCRADYAQTQHYRHLLDLHAIQHGNQWQVDWIALAIEGFAGALWSDLPMLSRTVDRLEQLSAERPEFIDLRDTVTIDYHFHRGDFAKAAALGESFIKRHAPCTFISWTMMYAHTALAHVQLGETERAQRICQLAFSHMSVEDRAFVVIVLPLEAAYATTLAMLGERERAESIFEAFYARQQEAGDHVQTFRVLQYRLEMLRLLGDRTEQTRTLAQMRESARASGNASLIALIENMADSQEAHSSPLAAANDQLQVESSLDTDETSIAAMPIRRH